MINKNTRTTIIYLLTSLSLLFFTSCKDEEEKGEEVQILEVQTATDMASDIDMTGKFTFFSFTDGLLNAADSNSTKWDIAFSGTTLLTNGGTSGPGAGAAQIIESTFEALTEAPETGYFTDEESKPAIVGSDGQDPDRAGWYTYTGQAPSGPQHAILTVPGRIIVLKTAEGNYAKMEILSYYKGNPDPSTAEFTDLATRPSSRYFTFQYVVQTNGSTSF